LANFVGSKWECSKILLHSVETTSWASLFRLPTELAAFFQELFEFIF
jgi:hypothetical protein